MMFKCSDCGKITEIRPKFCDCGNNEFEEIQSIVDTVEKTRKNNMNLCNRYSEFKSLDFLSWIIFLTCLVLSTIPWFFVLKSHPIKNSLLSEKLDNSKQITGNLRKIDIDKIWDDTPPASPVEIEKEPEPQTITQYVTQIIYKPRPETSMKNIPDTKSSVVEKKEQSHRTELVQSTKTKPDVISRIEKNLSEDVSKKNEVKNSQQVKTEKTQIQNKPKIIVEKPTATELAELSSYKNNLRVILLSKLKVQSVVGEGDCEIEFAINENGKLINRKFTKQSDNKTMNDAVYYMLMSVPLYKVPPSAYKGETIKMHFYINNGYYEISFK